MSIHYTPEEISEILNEYFSGITHKQYIGARYVPIFGRKGELSIEWDNTGTYEPLTIVLYQGNSFTSRQFVPVGVDINNEQYWAETGNYNAQVEMYRREVLQFREEVPNLIKQNSGISYVGNYGAEEKDDTVDWQEIIDEIAEVSNTIDFGNGIWYISEEIEIPDNIENIIGKDAVLIAQNEIDSIFNLDHLQGYDYGHRFFSINNIVFDGDAKAECGVKLTSSGATNVLHVENCKFKDFTDYCIYSDKLGNVINGCSFIQNEALKNTGVAIHVASDSQICNNKMFLFAVFIECGKTMVISNNYMWSYRSATPTIGIKGIGTNTVSGSIIKGNEFDNINYVTENVHMTKIIENTFTYNGIDDTYEGIRCLVHWTNTDRDCQLLEISDNCFGFDSNITGDDITRYYDTFKFDDNSNKILIGYESHGNVLRNLTAVTLATYFSYVRMSLGWAGKINIAGSYGATPRFIQFAKADGAGTQRAQQAFIIEQIPRQSKLSVFHDDTNFTAEPIQTDQITKAWISPSQSGLADNVFYISGQPISVSRIYFGVMQPRNMVMVPLTETPTLTGLTEIDADA